MEGWVERHHGWEWEAECKEWMWLDRGAIRVNMHAEGDGLTVLVGQEDLVLRVWFGRFRTGVCRVV